MREACWTCRNRTIQCDRSRIPCAKCEKAGIECFEKKPLKWVTGVAIRGKMRGISFKNNDNHPIRKTAIRAKRKQAISSDLKQLAANQQLPRCLEDPQRNGLNASSKFYLDYFNVQVCKLYTVYDSHNNPFRDLLPYAMHDVPLQNSIIALAARHFANSGRPFDQPDTNISRRFAVANIDAFHFKGKAMEEIGSALKNPENPRNSTLAATILLLIFLDLLESGIDGWNYHLRGAKELVNHCSSVLESELDQKRNNNLEHFSGELSEQTKKFLARQFTLISTLGEAFSGSKSRPVEFPEGEEEVKQESIVRSFLGCPEDLLKAIRYFSSQRDMLENLDCQNDELLNHNMTNITSMLEITATFDCLRWSQRVIALDVAQESHMQMLSLLAQAYKLATMLYGRRILGAFSYQLSAKAPSNKELVCELLTTINQLEADPALFKCLLWPTFIAGLECQTGAECESIAYYLRGLWDLTSCLNVISAYRILKEYWREADDDGHSEKECPPTRVIDEGWLLI